MTRQRTRLGSSVGRAATGLVSAGLIAAMVLLAPPASATPESDADAAITAAWGAGGGDTGPLGPKDGGVYPAGTGFGQNFAGGKIFFTPETGAHNVQGAILDKYQSLGGPADGDLGFPTIDEGAGRAANSRNSTFSAPDSPVIFWTPDTGARVVRGALNTAWDALGGSAGVLGVPSEDEVTRGDVVSQKFTGGELSWDRKARAFTTTPPELAEQLVTLDIPTDATSAIAAARRAAGGPLGPLGAEDGAQYAIGADGVGQNFAGGKIFYSPQTGANVVTGLVLAKYESVGGAAGDLGFPTSSETDGRLEPASRVSTFAAPDKPVIFWTPDFGAVIVRGAMNAAWDKLGGATGELGAPKSDQVDNGDTISQQFGGGTVSWNKTTSKFSTEPAGLQSQLVGLEVPAADAPQAPAAATPSTDDGGKWFSWSWWWLLALIPLLGLLALIGVAVLRNRRTHGDDDFDYFGDHPDDDDFDRGYDTADDYDRGYDRGYDTADSADSGYDNGDNGDNGDNADSGYEASGFAGHSTRSPDPVSLNPWAAIPAVGAARTDFASTELDHTGFDDTGFDDAGYDDGGISDEYESDPDEYGDEVDALDFDSDTDSVDTAPTRILSADDIAAVFDERGPDERGPDERGPDERGTAASDALYESDFPSGRHAAIQSEEPDTRTSMLVATGDRLRAPEGYPIKADTQSGRYWAPGTPGYREAEAEIWFSSEEYARTNGFIRAD